MRKRRASSVVWAMVLIGVFYTMATFSSVRSGVVQVGQHGSHRPNGGVNMAVPQLGGGIGPCDVFFAFISAVAFATILAVVAGLTISASTSFAHDFFTNVINHGREAKPGQGVVVARITAFIGRGTIFFGLSIGLGPNANVAFLVRPCIRFCSQCQSASHSPLYFLETLQHGGRDLSFDCWSYRIKRG